MTFSDVSLHIRRWNFWRKRSRDSLIYKLLVLFRIIKSPSMEFGVPMYLHGYPKRKR